MTSSGELKAFDAAIRLAIMETDGFFVNCKVSGVAAVESTSQLVYSASIAPRSGMASEYQAISSAAPLLAVPGYHFLGADKVSFIVDPGNVVMSPGWRVQLRYLVRRG